MRELNVICLLCSIQRTMIDSILCPNQKWNDFISAAIRLAPLGTVALSNVRTSEQQAHIDKMHCFRIAQIHHIAVSRKSGGMCARRKLTRAKALGWCANYKLQYTHKVLEQNEFQYAHDGEYASKVYYEWRCRRRWQWPTLPPIERNSNEWTKALLLCNLIGFSIC